MEDISNDIANILVAEEACYPYISILYFFKDGMIARKKTQISNLESIRKCYGNNAFPSPFDNGILVL